MSDIRRVTLSDIAKEAKVHVTTVSLALRDHPRIPAETKQRIKDLAKKMGYAPDPILSAWLPTGSAANLPVINPRLPI